jgi:hypothetical protein
MKNSRETILVGNYSHDIEIRNNFIVTQIYLEGENSVSELARGER